MAAIKSMAAWSPSSSFRSGLPVTIFASHSYFLEVVMKIRMCFVSNSSSLSCVVVGIPRTLDDITEQDLHKDVVCICNGGYEGTDLVSVRDMEMLTFLRNHPYVVLETYINCIYGETVIIDQDMIGATAFGVEADQDSCESLSDLEERYG